MDDGGPEKLNLIPYGVIMTPMSSMDLRVELGYPKLEDWEAQGIGWAVCKRD